MKKVSEIFKNKEEFKSFAFSEKITDLVKEYLEKEETMILIDINKDIKIISGEKFDNLLLKKDSSLNSYSELCCIGEDVSEEDHINNINYKYNKF